MIDNFYNKNNVVLVDLRVWGNEYIVYYFFLGFVSMINFGFFIVFFYSVLWICLYIEVIYFVWICFIVLCFNVVCNKLVFILF